MYSTRYSASRRLKSLASQKSSPPGCDIPIRRCVLNDMVASDSVTAQWNSASGFLICASWSIFYFTQGADSKNI